MNHDLPQDYQTILDLVKLADSAQGEVFRASILGRNDWLCDFVAYWPNVRVEVNPSSPPFTGKGQTEMWDWLWGNCTIPSDSYCASGLTRTGFSKLFDIAKSARLVYPDGDINPWARRFLNSKVMASLNRKAGSKGKR